MIKIPYTKTGLEQVQRDQQGLLQKRREILVRLQTAREMGDLSENGAYKAARFELGETDRELRRLNYLLKRAEVRTVKPTDQADFGSTVTVSDARQTLTFMLVSQYESDPNSQKISLSSPLGKAIQGKKEGDQAVFQAPSGDKIYTILAVK